MEIRHPHGCTGIRPLAARSVPLLRLTSLLNQRLITHTVMTMIGAEIISFMPREFTPRCEIVLNARHDFITQL